MTNNQTYTLELYGLPKINNLDDFALGRRGGGGLIYRLSIDPQKQYKTYKIKKKGKGNRLIAQPSLELKVLQAWILSNILYKLKTSEFCKGFEKGIGIAENALPHIGAASILNLDIEDYFPSIRANKVWTIFKTIGYNNVVSTMLTSICTYNHSLPQGAPSSPRLANLASIQMDKRINGYVGKRGIAYTRYADDMTFSSNSQNKLAKSIGMIRHIIEDENFRLNNNKTRINGQTRQRRVTGLVISEEMAGIGRNKYREIRARINNVIKSKEKTDISYLNGYLSFMYSVDKVNYRRIAKYLTQKKEKYGTACKNIMELETMKLEN